MSTFKGFTSIELTRPKRSLFDLSHEKRVSSSMGYLTPIFITETMPNDTFSGNSEVMIRLAPMLAPIMHRINVTVHYFFVPNRLLWEDWEDFITNGRLGTETPPIPPYITIDDILQQTGEYLDQSSLFDYLGGRPINDGDVYTTQTLDVMPFAAYYKVWYDYYRDRNYVSDLVAGQELLPLSSGEQGITQALELIVNRRKAWEHDYFTSALPWTQRGSEVLIPLVGSGSVTYLSSSNFYTSAGATPNPNTLIGADGATGAQIRVNKTTAGASGTAGRIENIDAVNIDNSDVSVNDFRRALRLQEWMERNAQAGSRYSESIYAHFGRRTSDGRLQRAQYLGGGRVPVKISEVVSTAWSQDGSAADVPQANMAGHGVTYGQANKFKYNCEEHGFIIGIMNVMPTSAYMQGTPRMFIQRRTFLDYPWPSFAHLGEQEVYNYEIYSNNSTLAPDRDDNTIFGYQSRYSDWKYIPSSSHGDFRTTLDFWHLTRKFSSLPVLGETFINYDIGLDPRIFAVSGGSTIWAYIYNNIKAVRSLPYFGTPQT